MKDKPSALGEGAELHTLDDLARDLGAPLQEVVDELFEDVSTALLVGIGRKVESSTLYGGVPTFVTSVRDIWAKLSPALREEVVGYAEEFLTVVVHDAVALRALHQRFSRQNSKVAIEVARRKESAQSAFTKGRLLRDQAARLLRRVTRGNDQDTSGLEASIGTADNAAKLAAGLTFIADEIERHLRDGSATRKRLLARIRLNAAYAAKLRGAAVKAVETDSVASAAAREAVSQEDLDAADGRVMHVVDWVYRAFKEASELDDAVRVPDLGDLESYFVTKRGPSKPQGAPPAPPTPT